MVGGVGELIRLRDGRISPVRRGYPLLPGRKLPVFMPLQRVLSCTNFITKELQLNFSKQMSYQRSGSGSVLGLWVCVDIVSNAEFLPV
jgi:hypothetical protein